MNFSHKEDKYKRNTGEYLQLTFLKCLKKNFSLFQHLECFYIKMPLVIEHNFVISKLHFITGHLKFAFFSHQLISFKHFMCMQVYFFWKLDKEWTQKHLLCIIRVKFIVCTIEKITRLYTSKKYAGWYIIT